MSVQSDHAGSVLDSNQALVRLGDDRQLYAELIGFVLEDAPILFSELQEAVDCGSASTVRLKAHALKGLVAGCGGVRAASAAHKVETAGEQGDLSEVSPLVESLRDELDSLTHALRDYCA